MLSEAQQSEIRARGLSTTHDYRMISLLSGEPFLEEGLLLYYDGSTLVVCAEPLRDQPPVPSATVRRVLRKWTSSFPVDMIFYIGTAPVVMPYLIEAGFVPVEIERRTRRKSELFLPVRSKYERTRVFRRAVRNGFSARTVTGGVIRLDHISPSPRGFTRRCR